MEYFVQLETFRQLKRGYKTAPCKRSSTDSVFRRAIPVAPTIDSGQPGQTHTRKGTEQLQPSD